MRDFLGLGRRKLAPPFIVTLEHLQGMIDNKALAVAVELEIPDRLHERPRRADELAREIGADTDALNRLLRFLVSRGLVGITKDGRYRNNTVSSALRRDHPWSARNWVLFFGGDWHWRIWNQAKHSFLTGESAAKEATGHEFFEYVNEVDPNAGEAFNGAMTEGSRLQGLLVVNAYDFSRASSVCDVGGGSGAIMCDLLAAHPHLRGVVSTCRRSPDRRKPRWPHGPSTIGASSSPATSSRTCPRATTSTRCSRSSTIGTTITASRSCTTSGGPCHLAPVSS
jgi:hypothetical protein